MLRVFGNTLETPLAKSLETPWKLRSLLPSRVKRDLVVVKIEKTNFNT
jgi:hypothetical protein